MDMINASGFTRLSFSRIANTTPAANGNPQMSENTTYELPHALNTRGAISLRGCDTAALIHFRPSFALR